MNYESTVRCNECQLEISCPADELIHIYQSAPIGLSFVDINFKFVRINEVLAKINGLPVKDHIGKTLREILPELFNKIEPLYQHCIKTGKSIKSKNTIRFIPINSDNPVYCLMQCCPLTGPDGTVIGINTIVQDITQQTEYENKLRLHAENLEKRVKTRTDQLTKLNQCLRKSNAELKDFAFIVSHDLQEPLRTLFNYCQLLEKKYGTTLDEKAFKYLRYITDGAKRMRKLVSDLLLFSSSIEDKESVITSSKLSFIHAMNNLVYHVNFANAKVTNDDLPMVMCNETQLTQVFQNLIGNALKFANDKPLKIHVSAKKNHKLCVFSVEDNGIGIEKKYLEHIFVIFRRIPKYPNAGSGVGLTICKKIVEQHGGKIWVESEHGKGTTFFFSLRLA